jgi:trimeric autotransporter adhesin
VAWRETALTCGRVPAAASVLETDFSPAVAAAVAVLALAAAAVEAVAVAAAEADAAELVAALLADVESASASAPFAAPVAALVPALLEAAATAAAVAALLDATVSAAAVTAADAVAAAACCATGPVEAADSDTPGVLPGPSVASASTAASSLEVSEPDAPAGWEARADAEDGCTDEADDCVDNDDGEAAVAPTAAGPEAASPVPAGVVVGAATGADVAGGGTGGEELPVVGTPVPDCPSAEDFGELALRAGLGSASFIAPANVCPLPRPLAESAASEFLVGGALTGT